MRVRASADLRPVFATVQYRMMSTAGKTITCRAAIAWEPKNPLIVEDVEVAPPKLDEIRIKICYSALCCTDTISWSGTDVDLCYATFPAVLGHEGAGIVESVGEGVTEFKVGDKVIPCFMPQCGECEQCKSPKSNLCIKITGTQRAGVMPDGTSRFTCRGKAIHHFMGCSTFSEYTVCAAISCTKIDSHAPLDRACLLGCGVASGYGAVMRTAGVEPGSRCAVFGLGGVGLSAVMACKLAGARQIVGIDVASNKFEAAKQLGATDCVNPEDIPEGKSLVQFVNETYGGGFDYTFECVGNVETIKNALEAAHFGWGVSVIVGMPAKIPLLTFHPLSLIVGRKWMASTLGGLRCRRDLPQLVHAVMAGRLQVEKLISHVLKLTDVNTAIELMQKRECLRVVITLE